MSLSQERPTNPASRYLKVKSGAIVYWDKESQDNIKVPTPFEFIVLDQLATVKGWSDADESGYWSNEVRRVGSDELTIRTSKGVKESGMWKEIKGSPSVAGAKYNASIYIAHKSKGGMSVANLALTGAALNAWIEFTQKNKVSKVKVKLSGWDDAKKGSVAYKVPVFEALEMSDEEKAEGISLDKELQAYFNEYFNYAPDDGSHTDKVGAIDQDVITDFDDDEEIKLSDIPF